MSRHRSRYTIHNINAFCYRTNHCFRQTERTLVKIEILKRGSDQEVWNLTKFYAMISMRKAPRSNQNRFKTKEFNNSWLKSFVLRCRNTLIMFLNSAGNHAARFVVSDDLHDDKYDERTDRTTSICYDENKGDVTSCCLASSISGKNWDRGIYC